MKKWKYTIATAIIIIFSIRQYYVYQVAPDINPFQFELSDLNGKKVSISEFEGKPIILNFFTTWCGPCLKEMPGLVLAQNKLANDDFVVLVVSDENINKIRAYVTKYGFDLPFYKLSNRTFAEIGINSIPTTYMINKRGEIVFNKVGNYNFSSQKNQDKFRALNE